MSRNTKTSPTRICILIAMVASLWLARPGRSGPLDGSVLFLSSYHPGFPTFYQQIDGIVSVLGDKSVRLDIEFMDCKRFEDQTNLDNFYRLLAHKLSRLKKYDVVMVADDNALLFALAHQEDLFKDIPIVFLGINNVKLALAQNANPWVTGVVESVSMRETLALMLQLDPRVQRIVALVDGTPSGQGDLDTFHRIGWEFEGISFSEISLTDLSFEEFGAQLKTLGKTDAVILLSAYRDKTGKTLSFDDSLRLIKKNYQGPLYHLWFHGLGDGIVGGKVISHFAQGKAAAEIAAAVLAGKPVQDIPVVEESPNQYYFDYAELKRTGLLLSSLPRNHHMINQPHFFYSLPRSVLWLILTIVTCLLSLVLVLSVNARRQRRIENALRLSEERFREIVEGTDDLITRMDSSGRFVYVSPAVRKIYGVTPEECLGQSAYDFIHPDDRPKTLNAFQEWAANKVDTIRFENRQLNRNGQAYDILWAINLHYDEKGILECINSIGRDISDLKQAEDRLAWEARLNALMAELSQALIGMASFEEIYSLILERAENMTGSRLNYAGYWDGATGRLVNPTLRRDGDPVVDEDEKKWFIPAFESICHWTLEHKQPFLTNSPDQEAGIRVPSGLPASIFRFLSSPAIVREQLLGVIALANADRDYTERDLILVERLASLYALAIQRHQASIELEKALTAAEAASRAKTEFLANVSHELRTPLIPVIGVTDMLLDSEEDPEKRSFLRDVKDSGQNLLRIIDELIELSRMEANGIDLRLELFKLDSLLKMLVISMASAARTKKIVFKTFIGPDVPPVISGDEKLLNMILSKLGENAVKFTQAGEIIMGVEKLDSVDNMVRLHFSIADTGIGIPESQRELLFQDFTQADGSKSRRFGGIGLGLTIVRRSVQVLGGQIWVESVEDQGSIFHVVIPFDLPDPEAGTPGN